MKSWIISLFVLLVAACAGTAVNYASDPEDRTGWTTPWMCHFLVNQSWWQYCTDPDTGKAETD